MKNLKNILAAITLVTVLMVSSVTAKTGLLVSDLTNSDTKSCSDTNIDSPKVDNGILVTFTGILVTFTGILVTFSEDTQTDCGILMSDN